MFHIKMIFSTFNALTNETKHNLSGQSIVVKSIVDIFTKYATTCN